MFKKLFAAVLMLTSAGCAMPTHTAKPDANFEGTRTDKNGLLVGSVVENFLTQPHGLYALFFNKKTGKREAAVSTYDRGIVSMPNDIKEANRVGKYFALEVPVGTYSIEQWGYRFYEGKSLPKDVYPTYSVEAGKATYIGRIHADALPMLMRIEGDFAEADISALRAKYDLSGIAIDNKCSVDGLKWWNHDKTDEEHSIVETYLQKYPTTSCR